MHLAVLVLSAYFLLNKYLLLDLPTNGRSIIFSKLNAFIYELKAITIGLYPWVRSTFVLVIKSPLKVQGFNVYHPD